MLPYMTDVLKETSAILPVTILTNGTLFNKRRLQELQQLVDCDIRIQLSLDHPDPIPNDQMRGKNNFDTVVEVIPRLKALGLHVRIATTVEHQSDDERMRLQQLVHSLGIPTKDHVIRKIVSRGRAVTENLGFTAPIEQLMPELTISTVGAFWSPFGPTFKNGSLQTDLLISKTTYPLVKPLNILLDFLGMVPRQPGDADGFV